MSGFETYRDVDTVLRQPIDADIRLTKLRATLSERNGSVANHCLTLRAALPEYTEISGNIAQPDAILGYLSSLGCGDMPGGFHPDDDH
ncbi:MAG: hypothetical protein JOZ76_18090 [Bradyrhizobium sp.]|nr:hypothetical protein [Bradyrhizobium sp.]MBV8919972.1 hypothetical protein [Bradyrhizobium sp.]